MHCSSDQILTCILSHFLSVKRFVVNLGMNFVISYCLKLALTVVKGVVCDVDCVKHKMGIIVCFISVERYIKVNLKAKLMNAYFQHLLYYKSERKYFICLLYLDLYVLGDDAFII